jgi:hypothetical protein
MTANTVALSGDDASAALTQTLTLGRVAELVSYLKADIGPVECTRPGSDAQRVEDGMWAVANPEGRSFGSNMRVLVRWSSPCSTTQMSAPTPAARGRPGGQRAGSDEIEL